MSINNQNNLPYKSLGLKLQRIRQKKNQSISEVSGSVEIDEKMLISIEEGKFRPSEDILLLLIAHFTIDDNEASKIWELAGYESNDSNRQDQDPNKYPPILMLLPTDNRVIYSDKAEIVANTNGIVINFLQLPNGPYQQQTISRIGMSREQATQLVSIINKTLAQSSDIAQKAKPKEKPID